MLVKPSSRGAITVPGAVARSEAHAKINLTLKVIGRRPDGFHALESVVMPLALHDDVEVRVVAVGEKATVSVETVPDGVDCAALCAPADNLCAKAARAFLARLPEGSPLRGAALAVRVVKRIPLGGGLGGGSADAAAVIRALSAMAGPEAPNESILLDAASDVGSDVPALLLGGPVLMEGRGERVVRLDPGRFAPLPVVVANPGVHVSTAAAYAEFDRHARSGAPGASEPPSFSIGSDYAAILRNDLQASVFAKHPQVAETARLLREAGARHVLMAGSGASVFAIADSAAEAEQIAASVSPRTWVCVTRMLP